MRGFGNLRQHVLRQLELASSACSQLVADFIVRYAARPAKEVARAAIVLPFLPQNQARVLENVLGIVAVRHQSRNVSEDSVLITHELLGKVISIIGRHRTLRLPGIGRRGKRTISPPCSVRRWQNLTRTAKTFPGCPSPYPHYVQNPCGKANIFRSTTDLRGNQRRCRVLDTPAGGGCAFARIWPTCPTTAGKPTSYRAASWQTPALSGRSGSRATAWTTPSYLVKAASIWSKLFRMTCRTSIVVSDWRGPTCSSIRVLRDSSVRVSRRSSDRKWRDCCRRTGRSTQRPADLG